MTAYYAHKNKNKCVQMDTCITANPLPSIEMLTNTKQCQYYSGTGCDGMGMCCEKKTMIG